VFFSFGTRVDEGIEVFLGGHVELIIRESSLELLDFRNTTGTKKNTRRLVELIGGQGLLESTV
jgi:hypothetical protein